MQQVHMLILEPQRVMFEVRSPITSVYERRSWIIVGLALCCMVLQLLLQYNMSVAAFHSYIDNKYMNMGYYDRRQQEEEKSVGDTLLFWQSTVALGISVFCGMSCCAGCLFNFNAFKKNQILLEQHLALQTNNRVFEVDAETLKQANSMQHIQPQMQ